MAAVICCVHVRKPDEDNFRMAQDIAQVPADQVVSIDDRVMFLQVVETLGIRGIHHSDYKTTCSKLASIGLKVPE